MDILHALPSIASGTGGPPRSTSSTIRALHVADPSVSNTLVSTEANLSEEWRRTLVKYLPAKTNLELFSAIGSHTWRISPSLLRWLWSNIEEYDVAVIRAMLHPLSTACAWIARTRNVPYVVTPHGTLSRYTFRHRNTWLKCLYFQLLESKTLNGAFAIQCTTEQEREQVAELGTRSPIRVIPHPFDHSPFSKNGELDSGLVLFLSRLDPMKGTDLLIQAFSEIRDDYPEAQLVVAGSGENSYEQKLRKQVRALGLEGVAKFPGFVEGVQKEKLLKSASVFVLPSHRENFGIAAVEAMDVGLPVIVTREVDTYPEIDRYEAGIVIEPDAGELAEALDTLLSDQERCEKMGEQGQRLVKQEYAPEKVGSKLLDLYHEAQR